MFTQIGFFKQLPLYKLLPCMLIALLLTGCFEPSPDEYISRGEAELEKGNIQAALIQFKNAAQNAPENPKYRSILGRFYLSIGQYTNAAKELNIAWHGGHRSPRLAEALARIYWIQQQHKNFFRTYDNLPYELRTTPVRAYLSMVYIDRKEFAQARSIMQTIDAQSPYLTMVKTRLLLAEGKPQQAYDLIHSVDAQPSEDFLLHKGLASLATQDYQAAVNSFQGFLARQPSAIHVLIPLIQAELAAGKIDDAARHSDQVLKIAPNHPLANIAKAKILYNQEQFEEATKHADLAVQNGLDDADSRYIAALTAYRAKAFESSYRHLLAIADQKGSDQRSKRLMLMVEKALGYDAQLLQKAENISDWSAQDISLMQGLSSQLISENKPLQAKQLLSLLEDDLQSSPELLARSGMLNLAVDEEKGIRQLEQAMALKQDQVATEQALATALLRNGRYQQAREIAEQWLERYPERSSGHLLIGLIETMQQHYPAALAAFDQALEKQPDNLRLYFNKAVVEFNQGHTDNALQTLDLALEKSPYHPLLLKLRNQLAPGDSKEQLQAAITAHPQRPIYPVMLSKQLYIEGQPQEARDLLVDFKENNAQAPLPPFFWTSLYITERSLSGTAAGTRIIEEWLDRSGYASEALSMAENHFSSINDSEKMLTILDQAAQRGNDKLQIMPRKIQLLIDMGRVNQAESEFQQLSKTMQRSALGQALQGQILLKSGRPDRAIGVFNNLYERNPSSYSARLLGIALTAAKQDAEAIRHYRAHLEQLPQSDPIRRLLADLLMKYNNPEAITHYRQLLAQTGQDPALLNNLSYLYAQGRQYTEAVKYSQQAVQLAPDNPSILDTHAGILLRLGRRQEALDSYAKAYRISSAATPSINLNYARVLASVGDVEKLDEVLNNTQPATEQQQQIIDSLRSR